MEKGVAFFEKAETRGAGAFGAQFENLAMSDMTRMGHAFRLIQQDPTACSLAETMVAAKIGPVPERIVGKRDFLPAAFLELGARRARAVCKIDTEGVDHEGQPGEWVGTGFLVGKNLLLTNHHVVNSIETARSALCVFNYQVAPGDESEETQAFRLAPDELFVTSPLKGGLDYTFVWIDSSANVQYGAIPLTRSAFTVHPGDRANLVQHPDGRKKEVALHDNEVLQDTGLLLHYATDTEGGSSGSPVFNNRWELIALHHASANNTDGLTLGDKTTKPQFLNEGIKLSAIAADLERRSQADGDPGAGRVLRSFDGVDSLFGFFGALGRRSGKPEGSSLERLVAAYSGEPEDIDVGFWNVEWFTNRYEEKLDAVATVVADLNLDVWALSESSPDAAKALVAKLKDRFGLEFDCAFSEPQASAGKQSTTVLWNTATVAGERREWPKEIDGWFRVRSEQFTGLDLEAVHGKVFDRYPGLFFFSSKGALNGFDFHLVPLHLKAMGEGSLRRSMASKILAAAVKKMAGGGADEDWVIGGDFNAEIATGDFRDLVGALVPVSGEDEEQGAFTYLKSPKSLIDHVYLSPNLSRTFGPDDFYIVARDREIPSYVRQVSDHRPVLVRFSRRGTGVGPSQTLPASLAAALKLRRTSRKAGGTTSASKTKRAPGKAAKRRTRR
jgi:V8-like Glu-specific endopeptidase